MNAKRNTQTIIKAVCYKTLPITILTCIWCCSASAQELQLAPNTDPDAPYIYKEHRYTKDLIQLKLFTLIQDPEEFLKVFDFFNLDINYRNFTNDYNSYLITAALKEKWSLVKVLIERKIDVNGRDATGTTGLMYAAYCGQAEAVQLLLSAGADPSIKYRGEETALDLAKEGETRETPFCSSKGNYTQTIEKLTIALKNWTQPYQDMKYDHEHYPNQPYVYKGIGFTKPQIQLLLFSVLTREPEEFLKVFDFFNLDINYQNPSIDSYSYLIAATFSEKWSLVQPLLQRKTNVNLRDSGNSTAIMYSAFCWHVESVEFLILAGADLSLTNKHGYTALDLAEKGKETGHKYCKTQGNYEKTTQLLKDEFQML